MRHDTWPLVPILVLGAALATVGAAAPVRIRAIIPADAFQPEQGFCYIATLDCGEEGDRETQNRSQVVLLEEGKPLGPGASLHADIRNLGAGRYSHWTRTSLYLSTSDNSDPRTNGRRYEVASANPESSLAGPLTATGPVLEHTETITSPRHEYTVRLGGRVDFENGRSRFNSGMRVAFQPNLSLTIANLGDTPVHWPKVIANQQGDWGTLESLVAEFTRGATTQPEKALFLWERTRQARYHCPPLFPDDEFHDPVKLLNSYGLNLCDDLGYAGTVLFAAAGLGPPANPEAPLVRALNGHVQVETMVDGRFAFIDMDEEVFHWDRENRALLSGDDCMHDHDLARREVHYGPEFGGWDGSELNAALFGADDTKLRHPVSGHTLDYTLRPGERVELRWDNLGKYACYSQEWNRRPPYFGNSKFTYQPRLAAARHREGIAAETAIAPGVGGVALAGTAADAQLVYAVRSPWVICGGTVTGQFVAATAQDSVTLAVQLAGGEPQRVWEGRGPGTLTPTIALDEALQPHQAPAKYGYRVVIGLHSAPGTRGAGLADLRLETDVMTAPLSLPRLRLGDNRIVYSDLNEGPRRVAVTYRWQECDTVTIPEPPSAPVSPAPGSTSRETFPTLAWAAVPKATAYHVQVSLRPDFAIPYRPNYDVVINGTSWSIPYRGMFAPETLYHWRLRARSAQGVWSAWSPTWTFRWQGPMVPFNVRAEPRGDEFVLRWEPNPRGERPVAYKVYGSDEKGFPEHDEDYPGYTRGTVPANLLGRTATTEVVVVTPRPTQANHNRCFYRVVAVDAQGVESCSSAYAELPHPHLWSRPPAGAPVGKAFAYIPGVLTSLGDVQYRAEAPTTKLWDREVSRFELAQGPDWLRCNPETGELSGTPPAVGEVPITIVVTNQLKGRAEQAFTLKVTP
jgi:hypothetical protein